MGITPQPMHSENTSAKYKNWLASYIRVATTVRQIDMHRVCGASISFSCSAHARRVACARSNCCSSRYDPGGFDILKLNSGVGLHVVLSAVGLLLNLSDTTLQGSQSTVEPVIESIPRFQIRINTEQIKYDAFVECFNDQLCSQYLDLSDSVYLNRLYDYVISQYYTSAGGRRQLLSQ